MSENQPYEDNIIVDSYEIIKGPAQVLYVNGLVSGTLLKSTRKPLPYNQIILTASVDGWGQFRATADFTGPLGYLGETKVMYRVVSAYPAGGGYFYNVRESRRVRFRSLKFDYKSTMVRMGFDFQTLWHISNGLDILSIPSGDLYTGMGRRESDIVPRDMEHHESKRSSIEIDQKVSSSWEMRLQGSWWDYTRFGQLARPSAGYNWAAQTISYIAAPEPTSSSTTGDFLGDAIDHYRLAGLKNEDAIGAAYSDWTVLNKSWTTSPLSGP